MQGVGSLRRKWIAGALAVVVAGCAPPPSAPSLDAIASRYIALAQGLARHDPTLIDHWLTGTAPALTMPRQPVATLRASADALARDVATLRPRLSGAAAARADWLAGQAGALQFAARRLLGETVPFDEEARLVFGVTRAHAATGAIAEARARLAAELPGTGPLPERLGAFRARFRVPASRREAVMRVALAACREATRSILPLPGDEQVEVAFVDGLPWDAHARYLGAHRTHIDINASAPLDLTRALRLACHEGYAGHHAQHIWLADEIVTSRGWLEYALVPGFGPALLLAEGAAEAGSDLAMPPDRRAALYLGELAPAAGLTRVTVADVARLIRIEQAQAALEPLIGDLAAEYLDNRINATTTAERLEQEALVANGEAFVPFIERRRTRLLAYTEGQRLVLERLAGGGLSALHGLFVPSQ